MDIKNQIDYELRDLTLPKDFQQTVMGRSIKPRKKAAWYAAAALLLCIVSSTTVWAGYALYNSIHVNEETLPPLQPMEKKEVQKLFVPQNELGYYTKDYAGYQELCGDLGISLLHSDFSKDNPYMLISRKTDNKHWNEIHITAYIIGDVTNMVKVQSGTDHYYTFDAGKEYGSPIDLSIMILCSDEQLTGYSVDFLGDLNYAKTYHSSQGYVVHIIQDSIPKEYMYPGFKPNCRAILVADGIQYQLSGHVTMEKMESIIDSLHFS
ncbi:MAG: hypothetical protein K2N87_13875 [Eubacterium sp.]|nr:hypothetical protein [Eubacterium sp.]